MKQYKLKKDLPTFNEGDEFCLNNNNDLYLKDSNIMAYSHITLEKFPNILTDWFEEIPEESKRWRAEYGEEYWYASDGGHICCGTEDGHIVDNHRFLTGNYFKTREEAEAYKEYLLARQILIDDAEGGRFASFKTAYFARYTFLLLMTSRWSIDYTMNKYSPGKIYFKDDESLKKSLEQHEEQWEIVRKYEMGE
nr:MAG TPA: hypothetical protein [Caudoviricetes sp.]